MRFLIIGAGAIGGTIGGRLAGGGHDVVLAARGAHRAVLASDGLRLTTPDGTRVHRLPTVEDPRELGELRPDDVLLLAVKTQDAVAALDTWSALPVAGGGTAGERLPVVCAQNGVEGERLALRRFRRVHGMCVVLPATFVEPGAVAAPGAPLSGVLHLGRYPGGTDETAERISAALCASHFDAPVVADVMRWKYGKLLGNLGNAIEALSGPLTGEDAQDLYRRARAEGEAVLAAAGIRHAGEQEQREVRGERVRLVEGPGFERGGGSSWQSLTRSTGTIEADYLNGEIVLLGRAHGVATPVNEALQRLATDFARAHRPAGSLSPSELSAAVAARTARQ